MHDRAVEVPTSASIITVASFGRSERSRNSRLDTQDRPDERIRELRHVRDGRVSDVESRTIPRAICVSSCAAEDEHI